MKAKLEKWRSLESVGSSCVKITLLNSISVYLFEKNRQIVFLIRGVIFELTKLKFRHRGVLKNSSSKNPIHPNLFVVCLGFETMAMSEDFNFSELCRLCSLKSSHQLQIFDKEGEQRQLLFKIRSCIPAVVSFQDFFRRVLKLIRYNKKNIFYSRYFGV